MSESKSFNPDKIFIWLFIFTAAEVGYGMLFHGLPKLMLWSGLAFFAFLKGWLIMVYFMHLKFEGWVIKSLIVPTIFLMMVIWGYVSPDITRSQYIDHPIGSMYDNASGEVVSDLRHWDPVDEGDEHGESGEH